MTAADHICGLGDRVRLRAGPYAGRTGTVVKVHIYSEQSEADALVLVKLTDGRINSCPMRNLEMVEEAPESTPSMSAKKGGKK